MESSNYEIQNTPLDIKSENDSLYLLPEKSKSTYEKQYNIFVKWCMTKNIDTYSESVLLAYFSEKSKTLKSASLWSMYSMLKTTLSAKNHINLNEFLRLKSYLKKQSVGYRPKKSKTFSGTEICKFLNDAPDEFYLVHKVVLIIGIAGACGRDELVRMDMKDVEDKGSVLIINVPGNRTGRRRTFMVGNQENNMDYLGFYRKYIGLKPKGVNTSTRLFLKYNKGRCFNQPMGMNTIAKIPAIIANYLNLPNSNLYTGHCFRRSSATSLVNRRRNFTQVKCEGGWESASVAEGHIEDSLNEKIETAEKTMPMPSQESSELQLTEYSNCKNEKIEISLKTLELATIGSQISIKNCQNCTFNFNITTTNN